MLPITPRLTEDFTKQAVEKVQAALDAITDTAKLESTEPWVFITMRDGEEYVALAQDREMSPIGRWAGLSFAELEVLVADKGDLARRLILVPIADVKRIEQITSAEAQRFATLQGRAERTGEEVRRDYAKALSIYRSLCASVPENEVSRRLIDRFWDLYCKATS